MTRDGRHERSIASAASASRAVRTSYRLARMVVRCVAAWGSSTTISTPALIVLSFRFSHYVNRFDRLAPSGLRVVDVGAIAGHLLEERRVDLVPPLADPRGRREREFHGAARRQHREDPGCRLVLFDRAAQPQRR